MARQIIQRLATVGLWVAVLAATAMAQGVGGRGGPGGPAGGPMLLMRQDVQQELTMTQAQIQAVRELLPPPGRGGDRGGPPPGGDRGGDRGGPPPGGGHDGPPAGGDNHRQHIEQQLRQILNQTQFTRYQQLALQFDGPKALGRPDVQQRLEVTDAQKNQMRPALEAHKQAMQALRDRQLTPDERDQAIREIDNRLNQAMMGILTNAQKQEWQRILGARFQFQRQGPPPR